MTPEAILLVKNPALSGNGNVMGGTLNFELVLKGDAWVEELRQLKLLREDKLIPDASVKCTLKLGSALHETTMVLKSAAP